VKALAQEGRFRLNSRVALRSDALSHAADARRFFCKLSATKSMCGIVWAYCGPLDKVEEAFRPVRKFRAPRFDAPGAGTGFLQGTFTAIATGLNPAAAVTGDYLDASNVYHGFVRAPNGAIATFDVSGAGTGAGQGTGPAAINPAETVTGLYLDASKAMYFTASSWKASEPCESVWKQMARARQRIAEMNYGHSREGFLERV
jgi:hypothetical protein